MGKSQAAHDAKISQRKIKYGTMELTTNLKLF